MGSPAETGELSATLAMSMTAQFTVMGTGPTEADPSMDVVTEAELFTVPQVALVVGEVMWTWVLAPAARSAGPKDSTPAEMLHPELDPPASMDQDSPALVGRVSFFFKLWATPAPVLASLIPPPIGSPAETGELSATLVMWMTAQFTVIGTGPT